MGAALFPVAGLFSRRRDQNRKEVKVVQAQRRLRLHGKYWKRWACGILSGALILWQRTLFFEHDPPIISGSSGHAGGASADAQAGKKASQQLGGHAGHDGTQCRTGAVFPRADPSAGRAGPADRHGLAGAIPPDRGTFPSGRRMAQPERRRIGSADAGNPAGKRKASAFPTQPVP